MTQPITTLAEANHPAPSRCNSKDGPGFRDFIVLAIVILIPGLLLGGSLWLGTTIDRWVDESHGYFPIKCHPYDIELGMGKETILNLCGKPETVVYGGVRPNLRESWIYPRYTIFWDELTFGNDGTLIKVLWSPESTEGR